MKIAVCGASGLVGNELCKLLEQRNIPYVGTYNNSSQYKNKKNYFKVDFNNEKEVEQFLLNNNVTAVCFLVVQRLVDVCEEDWPAIKKTNIDCVNIVSYVCQKLGIRFVHLSTDYVFDGSKPPYYPDSVKNPLQNYGISKLISELKVKANCKDYCIIRTPVLYCSTKNINDNAVTVLGKKVMDRTKQTKEDNVSLRRPVYVPDLCKFILSCIEGDFTGTYHFYNPYHKFTKYEMCKIIGAYLGKDVQHILPDNQKSTGIASRPYDTQLQDKKYSIEDFEFTDFNQTIDICFEKFKHKAVSSKLNKTDIFFLFDLDGTLIDTDRVHYKTYVQAFKSFGLKFISYEKFIQEINNNTLELFIKQKYNLTEEYFSVIKDIKNKNLKNIRQIKFIPGGKDILNLIQKNQLNYCIVTNTSLENVKHFQSINSFLSQFNNIITGDDTLNRKPDPACYKLAIEKYYKGETEIIGFENTVAGGKALTAVTSKIYYVVTKNNQNLYKDFLQSDGYIINHYKQIITE